MEIMRCVAGSHLYGTNTPDSDMDMKAVHLPKARDILLCRVQETINTSTNDSDSKNTKDDRDFESFTLQRFLSLAAKMTTINVEMLFIPQEKMVHCMPIWKEVVANRDKILNRNANAFVGYCRSQAVRYSARGNRLATFRNLCDALSAMPQSERLIDQDVSVLHVNDQVQIVPKTQPGGTVVPYLVVYGRQVPLTCKAKEALNIFEKPVKDAGKRAKQAEENGGADWKALYHAVRIAHEGIQLFRDGEITFPSQIVDYLMKVRSGTIDMEAVLDYFDDLILALVDTVEHSELPEKPDYEWIKEFVLDAHLGEIVKTYKL